MTTAAAGDAPRIAFQARPNVKFGGLSSDEKVVFFGNSLGAECQRCGAFDQTSLGHKYCAHVSCPIALLEVRRRKRKRTTSLERVYVPRFTRGQDPAPSLAGAASKLSGAEALSTASQASP